MMLRIDNSELTLHEGKKKYRESLFSGVSYSVSGPWVTSIDLYSEGLLVPVKYKNEVLSMPDGFPRIVFGCLEEGPGDGGWGIPYEWKGKPYSGLACDLSNEFCTSEFWLVAGHVERSVDWTNDGAIIGLEVYDEAVQQSLRRSGDGGWIVELSHGDSFGGDFAFNPHGGLRLIRVSGSYFDRINEYCDSLRVDAPMSIDDLKEYRIADNLSLHGFLTEQEFRKLRQLPALQDLRELGLHRTNIGVSQLRAFLQLPCLQRVSITDQREGVREVVSEAQQMRSRPQIQWR